MFLAVLGVILGGLLIAGGVNCITSPAETFTAISLIVPQFAAVMLTVTSICNFVQWNSQRIDGEKDPVMFWEAIIGFVIGIVLMGSFLIQLALASVLFTIMPYLVAALVTVSGIVHIVNAVRLSKSKQTIPMLGKVQISWGWELALGILSAALGIFSLCNPFTTRLAIGLFVGIDIIFYGVTIIVSSLAFSND